MALLRFACPALSLYSRPIRVVRRSMNDRGTAVESFVELTDGFTCSTTTYELIRISIVRFAELLG